MALVLSRAGQELARLAGEVERLQDVLSDVLLGACHSPELLRQAQALDHVFQHAAELAIVLNRAAAVSSPDWLAPADPILANISLCALAGHMTGAPLPSEREDLEIW